MAHRFPAAFEDTDAVFHWMMQQAAEYGLDTERVFAVGDSAGALGIGLYAAILTNPAFAVRWSFRAPEGLHIRGERKKEELDKKVYGILDRVGLVREHAGRYPHEFSGAELRHVYDSGQGRCAA